MTAYPKNPSHRDNKLRKLAEGEDCTLQFAGGYCDPKTTVWAHANGLGANKGMGYKGHDYLGVFACHRCHKIIDQPDTGDAALLARQHRWMRAQDRTRIRLREIANSPMMRPWKVQAARTALAKLGDVTVPEVIDVQLRMKVSRPAATRRKDETS